MAKIIGVHGVGQQFEGESTLRANWLPALKDGLLRAGVELASEKDFACAFYGDLFRPSGKGAIGPSFDASDVGPEWEVEMLEQWWREAANAEPEKVTDPGAVTKVRVPIVVQRALDALSHSSFFAGLAERALISDLKQVGSYFRDQEVRLAARTRVRQAIEADTRIIVAHSLGSVVAYETLCAHPELPVTVLVTIGSPLGIRNLIFDMLEPRPVDGIGIWPRGVKHWVNIADRGDVVALEKTLGSRFGSPIVDCLVYNGSKAHDATRYLTTKEVGSAVAHGL